jgi:ribosomal protein L1
MSMTIGGVLGTESRMPRINQETFAINITPKMKETLRGGMPLFSTVGGMVGLGALGSMPSTQDGGT